MEIRCAQQLLEEEHGTQGNVLWVRHLTGRYRTKIPRPTAHHIPRKEMNNIQTSTWKNKTKHTQTKGGQVHFSRGLLMHPPFWMNERLLSQNINMKANSFVLSLNTFTVGTCAVGPAWPWEPARTFWPDAQTKPDIKPASWTSTRDKSWMAIKTLSTPSPLSKEGRMQTVVMHWSAGKNTLQQI